MDGNHAAIEALYRDTGPALLAYARSLVRDAAAAEDVVHQVFLRLMSRGAALPNEPRPYLFRAVRNTSLNRLRDASWYAVQRNEPAMFVARDGLEALVPDLERALAALPEEQREAVVLRIWGGLTIEAAATVAGVSTNTAASRYRYGLAKLRERFGAQMKARHV
jgi:RNA polymerase sigma-70 factor (ECF subfamily)